MAAPDTPAPKEDEKERPLRASRFEVEGMEEGQEKTGIEIWDIKKGTGDEIPKGATVKFHYTGWLEDGTVFDSSKKRGEPIAFSLKQLIEGWQEAIPGMKVGGSSSLKDSVQTRLRRSWTSTSDSRQGRPDLRDRSARVDEVSWRISPLTNSDGTLFISGELSESELCAQYATFPSFQDEQCRHPSEKIPLDVVEIQIVSNNRVRFIVYCMPDSFCHGDVIHGLVPISTDSYRSRRSHHPCFTC